MEDTQPSSGGPTFLKGCGLIVGGVLLGFFGCLGALVAEYDQMIYVMLFLGLAVCTWGIVTMIRAIGRTPSGTPPGSSDPPGPSVTE